MDVSMVRVLLLYVLLCQCNSQSLPRPNNGLQECWKSDKTPALGVLPGGGWDNLRNLDMGRVMNITYGHCHTTEDGVYLIPDEVFVIPQKESDVEMNSEILSSWEKEHSSTARSINADVSFFSILNAKFSSDIQRMKSHQVKESAVTAQTEVRYHLYTVKAFPDFTLDTRFARQAEEIADALENNQTRQATYLSEKLVMNYGTHVITTVEAGALLVHEDYLKTAYVEKSEQLSLSTLAGASFFNKINIGFKSNTLDTPEEHMYKTNTTYSFTQTHGGPLFYPGITLEKWQEGTVNNLVAIDRAGKPLDFFLNIASFPHLPKPIINRMAMYVRHAVERYYKINSRPGCVKPNSKNFNFQANIDDGSCEGSETKLSFGGVYQQCVQLTPDADPICQNHAQKNVDTGNYTCREPFSSILLQSEVVEEGYSVYECHDEEYTCWIFRTCTKRVCGQGYHVRRARIDTFWCYTDNVTTEFSGYLFGGLYSVSQRNPLTKSKGCPQFFFSVKLLSSGMMVCLSKEYDRGTQYSVPFGGFFSCKSGNPLAGGLQRCPPEFSQQLAAISDGCQVLYCVQSDVFTANGFLPINLPPFTKPPLVRAVGTNTVIVMTQGDRAWVRDAKINAWRLAKPEDIQRISESLDPSSSMTAWPIIGIVMGCIVLVTFVVGIVFLAKRKKNVRHRLSDEMTEQL